MKKQKIKIQSIYGDFVVTANCPKCRFRTFVLKVPDGVGFFMTAAIFALAKIKTALEQKD